MNKELIKRLRWPSFSFRVQADKAHGRCYACGKNSTYDFEQFINDDLARQWGINDKQRHAFSSRESRQCKHCGATHRNRQYAQVLCHYYGTSHVKGLKDLVTEDKFLALKIAEINACGYLHQFLRKHPKLSYSEFDSQDPKIRSEDIQALSYKDNNFDLVLTSDTLEHVPDYKSALKEIHRVLKPAGKHAFTIPVIWQRQTQRRAEFAKNGRTIKYLLEPAYHGPPDAANLTWTDFGGNILTDIDRIGFKTQVVRYNILNSHDASCVFISTKVG
jgi:hypothetical protein